MLMNATDDVIRHADVESSPPVREDIDVVRSRHSDILIVMLPSRVSLSTCGQAISLYRDAKDSSLRSE